ncbi:MAG TPA: molybdopterin oxidoreductase family protein, partial [Terriglobales bacterium]
NGGKLIVVDPRLTPTARAASLHLRLVPGSDAALANGLLHLLVRMGSIDQEYIRTRTENFEQVKAVVASYWPDRVERITGVSEPHLIRAAELLGEANTAMVMTARGPEQQSQGVRNTLCYINLALALGKVGKPFSGYGTLTGQGNGQGGREHGQKTDQLPGYRKISDPEARHHMARLWGIPESEIPGPGKSAYQMLDSLGEQDGVHALLVVGSNLAVSAPNSLNIRERLRSSLDFLAVADFFLSETAQLADVVFPSAQWAEEEGTVTNLEGRVILRKRATAPPGEVRTDIGLLCDLAACLGKQSFFRYANTREVFEELRLASAGGIADYSGISYEKIADAQGIFWPCPAKDHPGTPRLFQETFPTPSGKAKFHAVRHESQAEEPDMQYPFYLTTGRILAQYQSGTQTRRVDELNGLAPEPVAELHPDVARAYQLVEGAMVALITRRGSARFKVKFAPGIQHDTVFVPFHWGEAQAVNQLTNPALDPTSHMPEFKVCAVRIENAGARPLNDE